jgi:hypothetical protein
MRNAHIRFYGNTAVATTYADFKGGLEKMLSSCRTGEPSFLFEGRAARESRTNTGHALKVRQSLPGQVKVCLGKLCLSACQSASLDTHCLC